MRAVARVTVVAVDADAVVHARVGQAVVDVRLALDARESGRTDALRSGGAADRHARAAVQAEVVRASRHDRHCLVAVGT